MSKQYLEIIAIILSALCVSVVIGLALSIVAYGAVKYAVVVAVIFVILGILLFQVIGNREKQENGIENRDKYAYYVVLLALLMGVFLFGRQFDYASIWGDIGVYVTAATHFKQGGTLPFSVSAMGWDIGLGKALLPPRGMVNPATDGMWQFHGLPVWPALMGISHLPGDGRAVLSILFGINIFLFYSVTKYFVKDTKSAAIATLLLAVLPLSWHQALYPTSEMLLLTIFLSGAVLLLSLKRPAMYVGAAMFSYGAVHTGIIILSPILGLVLFLAGVFASPDRKKTYALIGLWSGVAAFAAIKFAEFSSAIYTKDIISSLFGSYGYLAYVACLFPVVAALPWASNASRIGLLGKLNPYLVEKKFPFTPMAAVILVLMGGAAIALGYLIGWTEYFKPASISEFNSWSARGAYINRGLFSILHLSLVNMVFASAFFGFIGFVMAPWIKEFDGRLKLLWLLTCAFVVVFGLYRPDITNNYYSSRYFYPILVPCLLIFAAFLMAQMPRRIAAVAPVLIIFMFYNGATVGEGFFSGEEKVSQFLREQIVQSDRVAVDGSDWLKYRVYPRLLENNATSPRLDQDSELSAAQGNLWDILVTDDNNILAGSRNCIGYVERRIPWQITYPLVPQAIERNICIYRVNPPSSGAHGLLSLGGNRWIVGGKYQFMVVVPTVGGEIQIEARSNGWWALKKPFVEKLKGNNPELVVCGKKFELKSFDAKSIVFTGRAPKRMCVAELRTPTFVPSEIGDGSDNRKLGIDIYAISLR